MGSENRRELRRVLDENRRAQFVDWRPLKRTQRLHAEMEIGSQGDLRGVRTVVDRRRRATGGATLMAHQRS